MMKCLILSLLLALPRWLPAQIPIIPSVSAEQTRIPVFADFKPAAAAQTIEHGAPLANFRLHLDYRLPNPDSRLALRLDPGRITKLPAEGAEKWQTLELQYEQLRGKTAVIRMSVDGKVVDDLSTPDNDPRPKDRTAGTLPEQEKLRLDRDFTAMVRFTTNGDGSLFSRCRTEKWEPDAKMLGVRGGKLFYDIGWLGVLRGNANTLADGKPHTAVLRLEKGTVSLFVDGKTDGLKEEHTRPDVKGHRLHAGRGAEGFVGDLKDGEVINLRYWERALSDDEAKQLSAGNVEAVNTPLVNWTGRREVITFPQGIAGVPVKLALLAGGGTEIRDAWVQPLGDTDHAQIISRWNADSLNEGAKIYNTLCLTCHGSLTQEGSMPTSRHFHREAFKNGSDPFRQYQTLTQGYGLMMPMPQYTPEQKYAVIHYIRETFLAPKNPGELTKVDDAYLTSLPLGMKTMERQQPVDDPSRQFEKMNFGPALNWTYQVSPDNIAYKGIAVRLDAGDGGVSKGRAWMVYDHDTMRVATATTGSFVDWKGIAFDGSHGTHTSLTGERLFNNPVGPGWAHPLTGSWEDSRFRGRDGKPYGPLPREWARFEGRFLHGAHMVLRYTVGDARIHEAPEVIEYGKFPTFLRTLNIGKSSHDLKLRIAPDDGAFQVKVTGESVKEESAGGFHVLTVPAAATPVYLRIAMTKGADAATLDALSRSAQIPLDLSTLTQGGPPRWPQVVTTQGVNGTNDGPFATDIITHPESAANPWQSWIRLSGFDFFAGGERAAVCTWMGDVWIVEGLAKQPLGELKWRRIATGLFQPLGLKIVNETIFVCCRDQIARLHDLNADGETDFVECFNNDHQVTEHFHEFAMGLQTDAAGNFYYAKSARHALPAIVAQHGTLLRVSADGSHTDILATGFRAANGVCLNPDGTFFVTDQEGHWMPKNRINLVRGKGPLEFFGNIFGYHDITDSSDGAMQPPLCWITNAFDRSPSELLWVPRDAKWGGLNGSLLNLSYGNGKIYTVPFETVNDRPQGGLCALPMPPFPTGVMRGRFHPRDGQFYGCGMFAWAGNQSQPGGFYRVRYTGKPALQPVGLHFAKGEIRVDFSDALDAANGDTARYSVKAWSLKRSAGYGSGHVDEHPVEVTAGPKSVRLTVPKLHPAMGLEIVCRLTHADGSTAERIIHGTINELAEE